jgi:hypothetical protein
LSVYACGGTATPTLGASAAALNSANIATFAGFANLATIAGATTRVGPTLNVTATPGTLEDPGCVGVGGGLATFVVAPPTGGSVAGSATYSNFDRCFGIRLNGTASVTGTLTGSTDVAVLTLTPTGFTYTRTSTGDVFHASGTLVLDWKPSVQGSAGYIMTINAIVSDSNQGPAFKLDNLQIDSDLAAGVENVLISGRLTTVDGFVDINSSGRLELPFPSSGLGPGSLTMTGATQIATVNYTGNGASTATIAANR